VTDKEMLAIEEMVDGVERAITRIAGAITPVDAAPGTDQHGGVIDSLTEAAMSLSQSGSQIALAIEDLADAVRNSGNREKE